MTGSKALPQSGSLLMCVVPDIIKGHAHARDLSYHLGPYWIPRAMLMLGLYQSEWPSWPLGVVVISKPGLLQRIKSGPVVLH